MLPLLLTWGTYDARGLPAAPTLRTRIDWAGTGWQSSGFAGLLAMPSLAETTPAMDDLQALRVLEQSWTRGRSGDFSGDASGSMTLKLDNFDDAFTPDRNWCDCPSFEPVISGWAGTATSLTAAATLTRATDAAPGAGSFCGETTLSATLNSGIVYPIRYPFRAGVTYALAVALKSVSGTTSITCGLASSGTPTDIASGAGTITGSWVIYSLTWTPSADRSDGIIFVRSAAAAAAVVRIDAVQLNPGSLNAYIEAPTRGMLTPGRIVTTQAAWGSGISPLFSGRVKSIAPDADSRTVTVVCYDPLSDLKRSSIALPSRSRTHREIRLDALTAFGAPIANLWPNGSVEGGAPAPQLQGSNATTARITTDAAPVFGAGGACAEVTGTGTWQTGSPYFSYPFAIGTIVRLSIWLKGMSGATAVTLGIDSPYGALDRQTLAATLTSTWQRFTYLYTSTAAKTVVRVTLDGATTATLRWDAALLTVGIADYGATAYFDFLPRDPGFPDVMPGNMLRDPSSEIYPPDLDWQGIPYITNGNFETDLSGWTNAADYLLPAPADTFTRDNVIASIPYGSWCAKFTTSNIQGVYALLPGTFRAGVAYSFSVGFQTTLAAGLAGVQLGVAGDAISRTNTQANLWETLTNTWTPTADRTGVHLSIGSFNPVAASHYFDGAIVVRGTSASFTGSLGFITAPTAVDVVTAGVSGAYTIRVTGSAVPQSGISNLGLNSVVFPSGGRIYTALASVRLISGDPNITIGIGSTGAPSEAAKLTVVAKTTSWTVVRLVWAPLSTGVNDVQFFMRSEYGGSVFLVDARAVWPGAQVVDWFEPPYAALTAENLRVAGYTATKDAASVLGDVQGVGYTRHWVSPTTVRPWWLYRTRTVADLAAKPIAETYVEDIVAISGLGLDVESVANSQTVTSGTTYIDAGGNTQTTTAQSLTAGDGASLLLTGFAAPPAVSSSLIEATSAAVATVANGIVAARKNVRQRPTLTVTNRWPSQQTRDLDDLIAVTFARLRLTAARYLIQSLTTRISESGQRWDTTYQLEQAPE